MDLLITIFGTLLLSAIFILTIIIDKFWKDRRTKKYKRTRNALLIIAVSALIFNIVVDIKDSQKFNNIQTDLTLANNNIEKANKTIAELEKILDTKIDQIIKLTSIAFGERVDLSDPRLTDGGKIGMSLILHTQDTEGRIFDIGNPSDPKKNRVFLSIKRKKLILNLYDVNGERRVLEGAFQPNINKKSRVECVWSSKNEFMALIYDGEIIAKMNVSRLSTLIDYGKIKILRLAVGIKAPIHYRDLEIHSEKELVKK